MDLDLGGRADAETVLTTAIFLIVFTVLSVAVFRAMDKPRLRLTWQEDRLRATRRDLVLYATITPLLIILWWAFFSVLILLSPVDTAYTTLVVMPMALIISVRFLAHVSADAAYHLGSVVPLLIIASILVGEGLPSDDQFEQLGLGLVSEGLATIPAWLFLIGLDFVFTALWYWRKSRWKGNPGPWPKGYVAPDASPSGSAGVSAASGL